MTQALHRCTLAACCLTAVTASAAAQLQYEITDLGVPDGAIEVRGISLNSHGHVTGRVVFPSSVAQSFVWIDGEMTFLSIPAGFPGAWPRGISDTGIVCGNAWSNGTHGLADAILWQPLEDGPGWGEPVFLPTFGGPRSGAWAISPDGEVITGWSYGPNTQVSFKAFRYHVKSQALEDMGLLPYTGVMSASGAAINAKNQVAVLSLGGSLTYRGFIDDPVEGKIDIGTFGSWETRPEAISNEGHVAGWGQNGDVDEDTSGGMAIHAFRWYRGRMIDLGTLDGFIQSRAYGVNSSGTVVGTSFNDSLISSPRRAFAWQDDEMFDLNDLIPPDTGWILEQAEAINDFGQIVGWGMLGGMRRAFLLTPER